MAKFQPGKSGNLNGRPKGTQNKIKVPLKEELDSWLTQTWPRIKRDINQMKPEERVKIWERILAYKMPKPRDPLDLNIDVKQLTDSQLDELLDRLLEKK